MNAFARSALAAVLLIVPVAIEIFVGAEALGLAGHVVFVVTQLAGWGLLVSTVRLLFERAAGSRWGFRLVLAGCVLQLVFAAGYGITAVVLGEPAEGTFVVFLLAFLTLTSGGLVWGSRLLRARQAAPAGAGLVAVAVLGFLAMAVAVDPFHDVFLLSSYAAWVAVGSGTDRAGSGRRDEALVSDASR